MTARITAAVPPAPGSPRWQGKWIAPETRAAGDLTSLGENTVQSEFSRSIFREVLPVARGAPVRSGPGDGRLAVRAVGQRA